MGWASLVRKGDKVLDFMCWIFSYFRNLSPFYYSKQTNNREGGSVQEAQDFIIIQAVPFPN